MIDWIICLSLGTIVIIFIVVDHFITKKNREESAIRQAEYDKRMAGYEKRLQELKEEKEKPKPTYF